jgi:hypothetical protein
VGLGVGVLVGVGRGVGGAEQGRRKGHYSVSVCLLGVLAEGLCTESRSLAAVSSLAAPLAGLLTRLHLLLTIMVPLLLMCGCLLVALPCAGGSWAPAAACCCCPACMCATAAPRPSSRPPSSACCMAMRTAAPFQQQTTKGPCLLGPLSLALGRPCQNWGAC